MRWWLLLLFTVVPAAELFLLLQIGSVVGPTPTVLWLLVAGIAGTWLAKREGLHLMSALAADLQKGLPPAGRMAEGALVVLGAVLLVTPGVLTDVVGLALILPPSRRWIAPRVLKQLSDRFALPTDGAGPDPQDPVRLRRPGAAAPHVGSARRASPERSAAHPFANPFDDLP